MRYKSRPAKERATKETRKKKRRSSRFHTEKRWGRLWERWWPWTWTPASPSSSGEDPDLLKSLSNHFIFSKAKRTESSKQNSPHKIQKKKLSLPTKSVSISISLSSYKITRKTTTRSAFYDHCSSALSRFFFRISLKQNQHNKVPTEQAL